VVFDCVVNVAEAASVLDLSFDGFFFFGAFRYVTLRTPIYLTQNYNVSTVFSTVRMGRKWVSLLEFQLQCSHCSIV
jgi:hypothetical protein